MRMHNTTRLTTVRRIDMPKYKIHFEYEDEIEAEDEETALIESTDRINEWIGHSASVEEIEDDIQR